MSRFSRRDFLITTAGAALAARGAGSATAATAPKRGGTLTATWGGLEPQSLFVPAGGGSSPYFTSTKVHERLLRLTADLKFEPVLALEIKPAVRAQVINLLGDLQQATGVSYLFISHDLSVVEHVSDRLIVMYLGRIIESGRGGDIWRQPAHPYTCALMAAAPVADPRLARGRTRSVLQGELPSPLDPSPSCSFNTRCPMARERCRQERPVLRNVAGGRMVACHYDLLEQPAAIPPAMSVAS